MLSTGTPVRSITALITVAASSVTETSRKTPPNLPTGVRRGSQIRASRMPGQLTYDSDDLVQTTQCLRQVGDDGAGGAPLGWLLVLAGPAEVDQRHEPLPGGDAQGGHARSAPKHPRRAPVAGQSARVGGQQHHVGRAGGGAEILLVLNRVTRAEDRRRDQRWGPVELGCRLRSGGLLEPVQRLGPEHAESPRVGQVMVGRPPRQLEQLVEQLTGNGLGRERLVGPTGADRLLYIHAPEASRRLRHVLAGRATRL